MSPHPPAAAVDPSLHDTRLRCRREFTRVARSFWLIPELIPAPTRDHVSVLYCFCRELDDAIDEQPDPARAARTLQAFRAELHGRAAPRPLVAAFRRSVQEAGLPLDCADHLLDGMRADLQAPVRCADDAALLRYAYRVSAAVGLLLAPLLGVHDHEALQRVVDLGLALQLSNVLLGVRADAARGRVYLPESRLQAAGLGPEDVLRAPADPQLRPVLAGLCALADTYYASAELGAAYVPMRYRHGVVLLGRVYAELGKRAAAGRPAPAVPSGLPARERLRHLAELGQVALLPHVRGTTAPPAHERALHGMLDPAWRGVHP